MSSTQTNKCSALIKLCFKGAMQLHFEAIAFFTIRAISLGACIMVKAVVSLDCGHIVLPVAQPINYVGISMQIRMNMLKENLMVH